MTCWRCGATMEDTSMQCPTCGAERLRARRHQAAGDIAARYMDASKGSAGNEAGQKDRSQPPARRRASASQGAPASAASRDTQAGRPSQAGRQQTAAPPRRARSMPPSSGGMQPAYASPGSQQPRMIRRHEYSAILPETRGYDQVNWLRLCLIAVICVVVLVAGVYFFLRSTPPGQRLLAANGRVATPDAYHEVGRLYMADGAISKATWALETAQALEPDNLEVLIDLGKVYIGSEQYDKAEMALSRAITLWPAYPEPYQLMVDLLLQEGRNYQALQLTNIALEKTEGSYFQTLYERLIPQTPVASPRADKLYETEIDVTLTAQEGAEIYYTIKGEDPITEGILYERPFHLAEGGWRVRAVAFYDGMYSEEQVQPFSIIKPKPESPKATLAPNEYDTVKTVHLRAMSDDTVSMHYTMDGTMPTVESKEYTGDPITLRIGKTVLQAIAVNAEGKVSNVMTVEYKCNGRLKTSMDETDTVAGLQLYSTTRDSFISTYGEPQEERPDGEDPLGTYTRLIYPFGYAVFLTRPEREPVLAELSTNSAAFYGPRDTGIGSSSQDIISVFRDEGGEANAKGNRHLYTLTVGKMGLYTTVNETETQISYYTLLSNGQYVSLSYFLENDAVVRMEWMQYDPA